MLGFVLLFLKIFVSVAIFFVVFEIFLKLCRLRYRTVVKKKPSVFVLGYKVFYADDKYCKKKEGVIYSKMLVSEKYGIRGKPDYILANCNKTKMIPIELKSGEIGEKEGPFYGDLLQLAAYFLIIEQCFGVKPNIGKILYSDFMFIIKNNKKLEKEVLGTLKNMRKMLATGEGEANPSFLKCKNCVCRESVCFFDYRS